MIPSSLPSQKLSNSLIATIRLQRHLAARIIIATQEPTIDPRLLDLCSITLVHRFSSPEWMKVLKGHLAGAVAGGTTERIIEEEEEGGGREDEEDDDDDEVVMKKKEKKNDQKKESEDIFNKIVDLKVGEALLFSPSAVLDVGVVGSTTSRLHRRREDGAARQQDVVAGEEEEEEDEEEGREKNEKEEVGNRKQGGHRVRKLGTGYLKVRIRNRVTVDGGRSRCVF